MTILNEPQRRVLAFVEAANHGGYSPAGDEVTEWVERPGLRPGKVTRRVVEPPNPLGGYRLATGFLDDVNQSIAAQMTGLYEQLGVSRLGTTMWESAARALGDMASANALGALGGRQRVIEEREPDETVIQQVQRFRWVATSSTGSGLVLTKLGRALLRADTDQHTDADVVMLDGNDPLAWGSLVGLIAEIGECLIVDPYLKSEQFLEIAKFTGTTRVILRRPSRETDLIPWQMYQAIPDVNVAVRVADPRLLHDRYIVGENHVYVLGCSLAGVGRKPTTLVPLEGPIAQQVRDLVEGWWESADPVGDPAPARVEPDSDNDADDNAGDGQENDKRAD